MVILLGVAGQTSAQQLVDSDFIDAAYEYAERMEEQQRVLYCRVHDLLVENQGLLDSLKETEKRFCEEQNRRLTQESGHKLNIFYNRALFILIGMVLSVLVILAGSIRPKNKR